GISSTTPLLANSSEETPVLSPLVPVSSLGSSKGEDQKQKVVTKPEKVQAILKGIKQILLYSFSIMHVMNVFRNVQFVAFSSRSTMLFCDCTTPRARANASHNHGLDPERLLVDLKNLARRRQWRTQGFLKVRGTTLSGAAMADRGFREARLRVSWVVKVALAEKENR
ncbi:hypothetical protein PHAVU_008G172100, partial [Phaseolus vulgaris]